MKNASVSKCSAIAAVLVAAVGCSSSVGDDSASTAQASTPTAGGTTGSEAIMSPSDSSLACSDDLPLIQYATATVDDTCGNDRTQWKLYADGVQTVTITCDASAKDDPIPDHANQQAFANWWSQHGCLTDTVTELPAVPDNCAGAGFIGSDSTGILINRCVDANPGCGNIYDAGREWTWVTSPSWYSQHIVSANEWQINAPDTYAADCSADLSCCDFFDVPAGMKPSEIRACDRFFVSSGTDSFTEVPASAYLAGSGLRTASSDSARVAAAVANGDFRVQPLAGEETISNGERLGHGTVGMGYALIVVGALMGNPQMVKSGQDFVKAGSNVVSVYENRREQRRRLQQERLPGQPAVAGPPDPTEGEVRRYLELVSSRRPDAEVQEAWRKLEGRERRMDAEGRRPRPGDGDSRIPGSDPRRSNTRPVRPRPRGR